MGGYYNFQTWEFDEERDLNEYFKCWVLFGTFCLPALKPLCLWDGVQPCDNDTMPREAERLQTPTHMTWDSRTKDGYWYFSVIEIPEEEQKQRVPVFRERMVPWIEDYAKEWRGRLVPELDATFKRLRAVEVDKLSNLGLLEHFEDYMRSKDRMWKIHMESMFPTYHLYGLFEDMCQELLGIDGKHPQFKALLGGYDTVMQDLERGIWKLGTRAKELGLDSTFQATPDDEQLLSKLGESDAGKTWLKGLHDYLWDYGWRTPPIVRFDEPSWVEKPSLALGDIKRAMATGDVFVLDEKRKRLVQEREQAEAEVLAKIPYESKDMFTKLLDGARWCGRWSEDHVHYCENIYNAIGRRVLMEMGRRYERAGVLDETEDIFFLIPEEIKMPALTMHRCSMKKTTRTRKEQWQGFLKQEPPPFIGDPSVLGPQTAVNPVLRILAPAPWVRPELNADLYGTGSASGVVEGIARVIYSEADFSQLQPGEVLVSPFTHSDWTSLFWLAKAVVTDHGGALAHAVIVGREYGIPTVAGTLEATHKIKTGDRVRVDGTNCCVYILSQ